MLRRLDAAGVDFVVIGGIAAIAHGSPQITQDLDIVSPPTRSSRSTERLGLMATLRGISTAVVPVARRCATSACSRSTPSKGRLDVIVQPDGSKGYEQLLAGSIEAIVGGTAIRVAGLDDLIAMKKAAGRPKDRIYVEELEAIKRLGGG